MCFNGTGLQEELVPSVFDSYTHLQLEAEELPPVTETAFDDAANFPHGLSSILFAQFTWQTGEVLVWLSVWSQVQVICIWSCCCHCHPIVSCSGKIQNSLPFWCRLTQVVLENGR